MKEQHRCSLCPRYYPNLTRHYRDTEKIPYNEIQNYVPYKLRPRKGTLDEVGRPQWTPRNMSLARKTPVKSSSSSQAKSPATVPAKSPASARAKSPATVPAKAPEKVPGKKVKDFNPPMATRGRRGQPVEVVDLDDEEEDVEEAEDVQEAGEVEGDEDEADEEVRRTNSGNFSRILLLFICLVLDLKFRFRLSYSYNVFVCV